MAESQPEVWLRGPVEGVPALLQPVAHALLQVGEEIETVLGDFPEDLLWVSPAGLASVGFHLQHMAGVVDRLFTYAGGEELSSGQRDALSREGEASPPDVTASKLIETYQHQVQIALSQLRAFDARSLTEAREVGRKKLPSTVLGLLFHSAEHVQRHLGQLLVTARMLKAGLGG